MQPFIATLDLEADHGFHEQKSYEAFRYLDSLFELLRAFHVPLTVFATGKILVDHPQIAARFRENGSDIQLHSFSHPASFCEFQEFKKEVDMSVQSYKTLFGEDPAGYRPPYDKMDEAQLDYLKKSGFKYVSRLKEETRTPLERSGVLVHQYRNGIYNVPVTVIPGTKIPFGLSWMNAIGPSIFRSLYGSLIREKMSVVFYFHLHDVYKTAAYRQLPLRWKLFYLKNRMADQGFRNLETVFSDFSSNGYEFSTLRDCPIEARRR
jgi:peptidoglycan/xylan/chitin deacetylase (PgdA/CDA1 family)